MHMFKNPGCTKPTKEELLAALKEVEEARKDELYNGEDKRKDHKKQEDKMKADITSAFMMFLDNLKELMKFMDDFNMPNLECYTINNRANSVHYEFGDYKIYGKTKEQNAEILFDMNREFMVINGLTKENIKDPNDPLMNIRLRIGKLDPNTPAYVIERAVYDKAKILQQKYQQLADTRYYIPEFIMSIPHEKVNEYFYMHLVNQNICDGIFDHTQVDPEIHNRLHWKFYPVMFIDPLQAKTTRETIQASTKFLNEHTEFMF